MEKLVVLDLFMQISYSSFSLLQVHNNASRVFPGGASSKEPTCQCRRHKRNWVQSLGWEDPLEKEMTTHSSILAWSIPWTEEPGRLLSRGHRVGHDWSDLACMHALEKEMATHSSILAWRILETEEPGGLPSMGSHRVGHDWSDLAAAAAAAACHQRSSWQHTQEILLFRFCGHYYLL